MSPADGAPRDPEPPPDVLGPGRLRDPGDLRDLGELRDLRDPRGLPPAAAYSYALPGGWVHLDVDPARRAASVRRALSERVRREPRLAPHLARLDRLMLQECAVAAARGAERVSLLAEPFPGGVATAAVTVVVARCEPGSGPLDATATARWLAPEHARAQARDPTAQMAIVTLAQQDAVRRVWTEDSPTAAGEPLAHQILQLAVPWPGRPRVALLTMASPARPMWPLLEAVFDACAQTFHWSWAPEASY